ncbi:MAG: hypothetical protein Q9168_007512 [Polycauliona sp. 1 TL-2023]
MAFNNTFTAYRLRDLHLDNAKDIGQPLCIWHRNTEAEKEIRYVVLARAEGIRPPTPVGMEDIGRLIREGFMVEGWHLIHTITIGGGPVCVSFDEEQSYWRRSKDNVLVGEAVAFPVEGFAVEIVEFGGGFLEKPGIKTIPVSIEGRKWMKELFGVPTPDVRAVRVSLHFILLLVMNTLGEGGGSSTCAHSLVDAGTGEESQACLSDLTGCMEDEDGAYEDRLMDSDEEKNEGGKQD